MYCSTPINSSIVKSPAYPMRAVVRSQVVMSIAKFDIIDQSLLCRLYIVVVKHFFDIPEDVRHRTSGFKAGKLDGRRLNA